MPTKTPAVQPPPRFADFRAILKTWPVPSAVAVDLGLSYFTIASWKRRGMIPEEYWTRLVQAAAARGFSDVTYERCREAAATYRRDKAEQGRPAADRYSAACANGVMSSDSLDFLGRLKAHASPSLPPYQSQNTRDRHNGNRNRQGASERPKQ